MDSTDFSARALRLQLVHDLCLSGRSRGDAAERTRQAHLSPTAAREAERYIAAVESAGASLLALGDAYYPANLAAIPDPPLLLHALGDPGALRNVCVAVVGARRCSRLGEQTATAFGSALARAGCTVVSGLAYGVDSAAHRGALNESGCTVAVLGGGLDRVYPAGNRGLAAEVTAKGGLLLSEYPLAAEPRKHHFPERNRIVSGLSAAVVVIEAGQRSGSLITARLAAEQGRDVLAVPGAVNNPLAAGCHRLLRDGAGLVDSVTSLYEELGLSPEVASGPAAEHDGAALTLFQQQVLSAVTQSGGDPVDADVIAQRCDAEVAHVVAALAVLEVHGFVAADPDGYIRSPT